MASATNEQKDMLLPMVYANLDPASIPDKDNMDYDAPLPEVEDLMARAQLCLESLYAIEFTNDIRPDICLGFGPRFAPSPNEALDFMPTYLPSGILEFLAIVDRNLGDAEGMVNPTSPFVALLLSLNVIEALSTAACALSISSGPLVSLVLRDTFTTLIVLLGTAHGCGYIPQALKHHLLRALVNRAHVLVVERIQVFNSQNNNSNDNSFMKACDNI
ncbi:hypothetical protein B0H13DRAFT_1877118 [Mycena leptocephala]|nr:hypothetical protein B0H13DRAFT_1877118 [Mycena leptocephala]